MRVLGEEVGSREAEEGGSLAPHRFELVDELVPLVEPMQADARVLRSPSRDGGGGHRVITPAHEGESRDGSAGRGIVPPEIIVEAIAR